MRILEFGTQITFDRVAENVFGERGLVSTAEETSLRGLETPFSHLVDALDEHLYGGGSFQDVGVDLHTATATMRLMFAALDMAGSGKGREEII